MFAAAAKRTALAAATIVALGAFSLVGAAGGAGGKVDKTAPSVPTNVHVTSATQSSVSVAWDGAVDDVGVTGYYVYGDGVRARTLGTRYTVAGLDCGQSPYIAVQAYDQAGNRSPRADVTVSTAPCFDTQPPSAPTGFRQAATSQSSVVLAWDPSTDNVGVVRYGVYRSQLSVVSSAQPVVTLTGLSCGSSVQYDVDAVDAAGNRSARTSAWVQTAACGDGQPPSTPTGLSVTSSAQTSVSVGWSASTDNVGVTGYRVRVNGVPSADVTQTSADLGQLACGTTYAIDVSAYDAAGNSSGQASTSATTSACSTPPPSGTWTSCANEGQTCAFTGTKEIRYGANGTFTAPRTFSSPTTCTNGVFGDPLPGATKHCELRDPASPSPVVDSSPPSQPSNLAVTAATTASVSLAWGASADNVGVTRYDVGVNGTNVQTAPQSPTTVSGLACGTAYVFDVSARDAAGNSSTRASLTGSAKPCVDGQPPTAPAGVSATTRTATSIALSWTASGDNVGVTGYGLFRGGVQQGTASGTTGIFSGLACNTNYTLAVDAYDAAGNHSAKTTLMVSTTACPDTAPPSTPTGLAVSNVSGTGLTLAWTPSTDNVGVSQYDVYRAGTKVATVTSASSVHTGLTCGTSYSLGVVARDAAGNSSGQASTNATTSACSTPPPSGTWASCANEGQTCTFTGTKEMRYGANGTFTAARTFSSPTSCTNGVFGDPLPGVAKHCELRDPTSTPPPPPPPPRLRLRPRRRREQSSTRSPTSRAGGTSIPRRSARCPRGRVPASGSSPTSRAAPETAFRSSTPTISSTATTTSGP